MSEEIPLPEPLRADKEIPKLPESGKLESDPFVEDSFPGLGPPPGEPKIESPVPSGPLDESPPPDLPSDEKSSLPDSPATSQDEAKRPTTTPKVDGGGKSAEQPPAGALQANWMSALHPGFRGEMCRSAVIYPSKMAARQVLHQSPAEFDAELADLFPNIEQADQPPARKVQHARQTATPPLALDGHCPVELNHSQRWVPGDPRCTAAHQGRTYCFRGTDQRKLFLAEPERYAPVGAGQDPVLAAEGGGDLPGTTDYCVTYDGRLYMFSGPDSLERFQKDPQRYAKPPAE